jgi:hypothetical protein
VSLAKEAALGDTFLPLLVQSGSHTEHRHWPGVEWNSRGPKSMLDVCLLFILCTLPPSAGGGVQGLCHLTSYVYSGYGFFNNSETI